MTRHYTYLIAGAILAMVFSAPIHAQQAAAARPDTFTSPKTPWGDPELQGIWTTDAEILVPFDRPAEFGQRPSLNEEELASRARAATARIRDRKTDRSARSALGTPAHWFEVGNGVSARTSLIVDPADGRMPPLTPEAAGTAIDPRLETGLMTGDGPELKGPEDTGLASRCLTRGIPQTWVPSIYNNGFQIVQTPDHVMILYERYHETRVIPLDGRPHVAQRIRQWIGDSRGHWEGNTLVVDVANFSDNGRFKGSGERLHVVERLTRVDADTINVAVTIEDQTRWTTPWAFEVNGKKDPKYTVFEFACHEGNYTMTHMLSAARNLEKKVATPAR